MGHKFAELAFTDAVKTFQSDEGTRKSYARMETGEDYNNRLGAKEAGFIAERDSFYMATVSETGWPYVQHRGGPAGFVKVIDDRTLGFADFRGNRQYVSVGNLSGNDRVSLFFMDYPNKTRLKLLGRARIVDLFENNVAQKLSLDNGYRAKAERGVVITVEAFDWNCQQHITPRYTGADVEQTILSLQATINGLEAKLAQQTS